MSIFAPTSPQTVKSAPRFKLLGVFMAVFLASLFAIPATTQAAGETYQWVGTTNDRAILATGGGFAEEVAFEYDGTRDGKQWYRPTGSFEARVQCGSGEASTATLQITATSPRIERDPSAPNNTRLVVTGHRSPCARGQSGGYVISTGTMSVINPTEEKAACEALGRVWKDGGCSITGAPNPDAEAPAEEEPVTCETSPDVTPALRFVACPVLEATTSSMWALDSFVATLLDFDVQEFEDSAARDAWRSFQVIAYSLIFIAGLVIVIGQAAGVQFLDAYTIKKALPRLLIAVIFIALSWEVLLFFVSFINDLGWWTQDLILEPFGENLKNMDVESLFTEIAIDGGVVAGAASGLVGAIIYMGTISWAGVGLLLLGFMIGVLIALVVIAIRTLIITLGLVLAPLAIACMILPATQNIWELWRKAFVSALVIFPLIMALLAAGKVASQIVGGPLAPVLFIAPYFLIPFTFKFAGGLIGRIAGLANDRSRGVFDRLRNARQNIYGQNKEDLVAGRKGGVRGRALGEFHRRTTLAHQGGLSMTRSSRGTYAAAVQQMETANRQKAMEEDAFFSTGDPDDARAAIAASSDSDFVKRRMDQGLSKDEAWQRLGRLKNAYGDIRTNAAKNGITQALISDPTAFNPANNDYSANGRQSMYNDFVSTVRDMESRGVDRNTAINMLRANKARPEFASMGHSDWLGVLARADQNVAGGGAAVDKNLASQMDNLALEQTDAYGVLRGNDRSIRAMAHMRAERIQSFRDPKTGEIDLNDRAVQQEFAALNALHQQLSNASPQKGKIMADVLMSMETGPTVQQREAVENIQLQMQNTPQGSPEYNVLAQRLTGAQNDLAHTSVRDHMRSVGENTNNTAYHEMVREYGSRFASEISAGEQASMAAAEARRQEEENH